MIKHLPFLFILFRKTIRLVLRFLVYFILFMLVYWLFSWLLSRITVGFEKTTEKKEIPIFIKSNDVHTDLVLPVHTDLVDWGKLIPYTNNKVPDSIYSYVGFGWGDKGFYLNTPTWEDLTFSTAFKAMFGLGSSALHVTYYKEMQANDSSCVKIWITKKQYKRLVQYVHGSFVTDKSGHYVFLPSKAISGTSDAFYDAGGRYSLLSTCNSWANGGLKASGQKAGLWTPFAGGIFCHYLKD